MVSVLSPHGRFTVDVIDDCVLVVMEGSFDKDQSVGFAADLREKVASCKGRTVCTLADLRRYELTTMDGVEYLKDELADVHIGFPDVHRAVVIPPSFITIFRDAIDPISHDIPTFFTDSMDEAIRWLHEAGFRLTGISPD